MNKIIKLLVLLLFINIGFINNTFAAQPPWFLVQTNAVYTRGYVGIGINLPLYNLHVNGDAGFAGSITSPSLILDPWRAGTITGGGTLTLVNTTNRVEAKFSGSTANITLPASPTHDILIIGTNTYNSGSQIITFSSSLPWSGRGYSSSTLTNSSSAEGRFEILLRASGGAWIGIQAIGDAWMPPTGSFSGSHTTPSTSNPLTPIWGEPIHFVFYGVTGEIDLPAALLYAGRKIVIYNTGSFTISIDPNGSEVIVRQGVVQTGGVTITLSSGAGNYVTLISDGARWITLDFEGVLAEGS